MALYYPEVDSSWTNLSSLEFKSDQLAIEYFTNKYGKKLMCVVRDEDPTITVIYENTNGR